MKKLVLFLCGLIFISSPMFGMSCITEVMNNTDYEVAMAYRFPCPSYDVILCVDLRDDITVLNSYQKTDEAIFLPPRSRTFLFGAGIPISRSKYADDYIMVIIAATYRDMALPVYTFWQFENAIFTGYTDESNDLRIMFNQSNTKSHTFTLYLNQVGNELIEKSRNGKKFYVKPGALHIGLLMNDCEETYQAFETLS